MAEVLRSAAPRAHALTCLRWRCPGATLTGTLGSNPTLSARYLQDSRRLLLFVAVLAVPSPYQSPNQALERGRTAVNVGG